MTLRTILLVDDEPQIRSLVRSLLARQQCELIEAGDGAEAMEVCGNREKPVDLLITDIVMPRMDGIALADRLTRAFPSLRVLYMSGKCEPESVERDMAARGYQFLKKPFRIDEFRRTVAELMPGGPAPAHA